MKLLLAASALAFPALALGVAHFNEWRDRRETLRPDREREAQRRALRPEFSLSGWSRHLPDGDGPAAGVSNLLPGSGTNFSTVDPGLVARGTRSTVDPSSRPGPGRWVPGQARRGQTPETGRLAAASRPVSGTAHP